MDLLTLLKDELNNNMLGGKIQSAINNNIQKGGKKDKGTDDRINDGIKISIVVCILSVIGVVIAMIFNKGKDIKKEINIVSGVINRFIFSCINSSNIDSYIKSRDSDKSLDLDKDFSSLDQNLKDIINDYKQLVDSDDDEDRLITPDLLRNNILNGREPREIQFGPDGPSVRIPSDKEIKTKTKEELYGNFEKQITDIVNASPIQFSNK